MSKINWLHISDLHFGLEKEIGDIKYIRDDLLDYVKNKFKDDEFDYLFVTGDIFYGKNFYNNESQKKQSIKEATEFFDKLISHLKITDRKNVFIVPGNHDTNRKNGDKEKYINEFTKNYKITGTFDEEKIQTYQTEFNEFCAGLKGINYCEKAHKLISLDEVDILMLNTSISSCNSEKNTKLLLGSDSFKNELNNIVEDNWEDESRPLFILAHHSPDYFIDNDREFLRRELDDKKNSVLYLCGHNHFAHENTIDNIHIIFCGTNAKKEKTENNDYKENEVSFLKGSFDTTLGEVIVYFYKWSNREWMENRDKRQDKSPHHAKTFEIDNPQKKLLNSKSESEAIGNFYDFLLNNLYDKSTKKQNNDNNHKYNYFKSKIESLVDIIDIKKPEWKFKDKYYRKFNMDSKPTELNPLEQLVNIIREEYIKHREVKNRIIQQNHILTKIINDTKDIENAEGFGILLYSKSMRVTDSLLSLDEEIKRKCIIYICAGNVRGNTPYRYNDGLDIAEGLFDSIPPDFHRFKEVKLIPDIYIDRIIKKDKIHVVLFGAVALYYGAKSYTYFSNTVGTELIIDLANRKKIPCIVIAEQSKAFNLYPDPICEKKITKFFYPNKNLINHINAEFEEFELINFKKIYWIISDQKKEPWEDDKREHLSKEASLLFLNKILKDRRKLSLSEDKKTITKTYLPEDKKIECDIILKLKNAGFSVPDIIKEKEDRVELKYYKGIRIFNFLETLDYLKKNEYKSNFSKTNQLNSIAQKLLFHCEENQKQIQKELYEQFKNSKQISPYPKDKLTDIIELFFACFKIKVDKQTILKEVDWIYEKFSTNAIVPFRDASAKNMILVSDDLYLELFQRNDARRNAEVRKLFENNKLQDIIANLKIIDIDFSSCINYTTPYDDVISFRFHEKTAPYYQSYNLTWNNIPIKEGSEKESIVATFIVRFLRFGGRKLLYRVIDPAHHSIRFKYDDESYYFKKLPKIIEHYKITELSETIKLFKEIENILKEKQNFFPIIPYDDDEVAEIIKEIAKKETYSDVYPC